MSVLPNRTTFRRSALADQGNEFVNRKREFRLIQQLSIEFRPVLSNSAVEPNSGKFRPASCKALKNRPHCTSVVRVSKVGLAECTTATMDCDSEVFDLDLGVERVAVSIEYRCEHGT
ncbi:hypothetical protein SAMN05216328_107278 [Ensifer sp. YR511]|nr:hypothetical protein SAMN05216328_107278 [Ensifer sp. YR511]